jgi:hypothetical protein
VHTVGEQTTSLGPVRSVVAATPDGRQAAAAWMVTPVRHIRDVRSELMVKLALLDRAGADPRPLLTAQREQLVPIADALAERLGSAAGFDRTLALWRFETVSAALRFLDAVLLAAT